VVLTRRQMFALPAAFAAAVVIGLSRYVLGTHSPLEVVVGACLGLLGAGLMRCAGQPPRISPWPHVAAVIVVVVVFHGLHPPFESAIRHVADCFSTTRACGFWQARAFPPYQAGHQPTEEAPLDPA